MGGNGGKENGKKGEIGKPDEQGEQGAETKKARVRYSCRGAYVRTKNRKKCKGGAINITVIISSVDRFVP